jgi:hypothetical protein
MINVIGLILEKNIIKIMNMIDHKYINKNYTIKN